MAARKRSKLSFVDVPTTPAAPAAPAPAAPAAPAPLGSAGSIDFDALLAETRAAATAMVGGLKASSVPPVPSFAPAAPAAAVPAAPAAAPATPGLFTSLKSNVKLPQNHKLGPCTAFVSNHNRTGKTAALDAIRLALTGAHPAGHLATDLARLSHDEGLPWAVLSGPSAGASFTFPAVGASTRKPDHVLSGVLAGVVPESLLPQVAWRELLTMGSALARDALFARFGAPFTLTAPAGMNAAETTLWNEAMVGISSDHGASPSSVETLSSMGSWLRSHKRKLSEQRKANDLRLDALRKEAQACSEGGVVVGVEHLTRRLEELNERVRQHQLEAAKVSGLAHAKRQQEQRQAHERELLGQFTEVRERHKALAQEERALGQLPQFDPAPIHAQWDIEGKRAALAPLRAAHEGAAKQLRLATVISSLRKALATGCLCCGAPTPANVAKLQAEAEDWLKSTAAVEAEARSTLQEAEKVVTAAVEAHDRALAMARLEHGRQVHARDVLRVKLDAAQSEYQRLIEAAKRLQAHAEASGAAGVTAGDAAGDAAGDVQPEETPLPFDTSAVAAEISRVTAQLDTVKRLHACELEQRRIELAWDDAKSVEYRVQELLTQLVTAVKTKAVAAVNAWMTPGFQADLELESGERSVCRWTVTGADGRPHARHVMSGAEWATLTVAVACAWSDTQQLRVVVLDDSDLGAFSPETLCDVLTHLQQAVIAGRLSQVFVAWSRPAEIPGGWHVVSM